MQGLRGSRTLGAAFGAACLLLLPATVAVGAVVVEFPGPVPVTFNGPVTAGLAVPADGRGDRLLVGLGTGDLYLIQYMATSGTFVSTGQASAGGQVVGFAPLRSAEGVLTGLLVATREPARVLAVDIAPLEPFLRVREAVALEEEPGGLALIGPAEAVVTLPGIDRLVWLVDGAAGWVAAGGADTGDRPLDVAAADLEGDGVAEVVVANAGPLSRSLMVFRRGDEGYAIAQDLALPGGAAALAAGDTDGDGRAELAVVSPDTALAWLLADAGGSLEPTSSLALTVPADGVHLAALPDGSWGLYASSSERGLLEYFRDAGAGWVRRDGYYPGCRPAAVLTSDVDGDAVPDLVSLGGATRVATVMFGSPDLGYWGFPALALPGQPSGLAAGDFDGNGLNDVVVMSVADGALGLFRGRADGGVAVQPLVQSLFTVPGPLAAVDAVTGGAPELAVCDLPAGLIRILACGAEGFAEVAAVAFPPGVRSLTAGDVDGDGHADLVLLLRTAPEVRVLFGAGDGQFPQSISYGFDPVAAGLLMVDLDADGRLDLVGVDTINRVATAANLDGRTFGDADWQSAGSGSRMLAKGDLDGDLDEDVVVVSSLDQTLTLLHNDGQGNLVRLVGSLALDERPASALVADVNQDDLADIVVNFQETDVIGVVYGLPGGSYTPPVPFPASGDVTFVSAGDFNADEIPDILTLDASLHLGLIMLNVERGQVPAEAPVLEAFCRGGVAAAIVRPPLGAVWRLERERGGAWEVVATDGGARTGGLEATEGGWLWSDEAPLAGPTSVRLVLVQGGVLRAEELGIAACGDAVPGRLLAWADEPWPNPFNPVVNARFTLARAGRVTATVHDLRGRRLAVLADAELKTGVHALRWDGRDGERPAAAGTYLLRIATDQGVLTGKLLLLK